MKTNLIALAAALLAGGCTAGGPMEMTAEEEARLAAELRGYEAAGPAISCVPLRGLGGNRSAGESALIFDGTGDKLWVNRPSGGCPDLKFGRALQTRTSGSQLCRGDIATVFDPMTGMVHGGCGLGDFTPYRKRRD